MNTTKTKEEVDAVLADCTENISEGMTDNFRSYEEGVKDALEWLFYGNSKPIIKEEE